MRVSNCQCALVPPRCGTSVARRPPVLRPLPWLGLLPPKPTNGAGCQRYGMPDLGNTVRWRSLESASDGRDRYSPGYPALPYARPYARPVNHLFRRVLRSPATWDIPSGLRGCRSLSCVVCQFSRCCLARMRPPARLTALEAVRPIRSYVAERRPPNSQVRCYALGGPWVG